MFVDILLYFCLFVVFYSYFGYGILIWGLLKMRSIFNKNGKRTLPPPFYAPVTLIVAAYNEEDFIAQKIENTLSLNYPRELLTIIFITDGSSDDTPRIVEQYPEIIHMHVAERNGKVAAMHRAMATVKTPFTIFSDANTTLNKDSIVKIMRHYQFDNTGGVAGEKKIIQTKNGQTAEAGEGLYWKYESFLKKLDSDFYSVVGAAGELFSVRTDLYENPGRDIILDDFIISLRVCMKGFRVAYEPDAYAMEYSSASISEEKKRKIRISAGAFQSIQLLSPLLNIFKYGRLSFQYLSHRVLRWTLCPLFLPIILFANIALVINKGGFIYTALLIGQVFFYVFAIAGEICQRYNVKVKLFYLPYYFVFINYAVYAGFVRFLKGRQTVIWEKASRAKDLTPPTAGS